MLFKPIYYEGKTYSKSELISDYYSALHYKTTITFELPTLNYTKMTDNMWDFKQELTEYVFNPIRLKKIAKLWNLSLEDMMEIY